ncbi:TetR family transcriptional regulator [Roseimicrobium gellanilyticum]|uniref:TetR family transcriptional regulator n=1 Tax=Roseimicrobium gellanilyticum TaxID=748857 RepID=A0A366HR02_9BACT|nr:TetR/AcrR family transcriptional regulator [Roseimicrobium gellanilyticum]RBP45238.1 TetR family transcriptional regulator [Roseimicrobium gellanilyticum]
MNLDSDAGTATPRKARERERKVEDMLAAASRVFAQKGFHGASMDEIAKAAEYATGALYRYFPGKEALYVELVERRIASVLRFVQERIKEVKDPVEVLRRVISGQLESVRRDMSLLQIYFGERLETSLSADYWKRLEVQQERLLSLLADCVKAGQKKGMFQSGNPRHFAVALQGMLHGFYRDWIATRKSGRALEEESEFITNLCLRAVLKSPKS